MFSRDEIIECSCTIQDTICELIEIENKLAVRHNLINDSKIQNFYRVQLFRMNNDYELEEDELVRDWHQSYSSYVDWIEDSPLYAKVYVYRAANEKYDGFTGKITDIATNRIRTEYGYVIYYNVRLANGIPMIFSNRELIFL